MPSLRSALTGIRDALAVIGCGLMLAAGSAGTAAAKGREVVVDFDYAPGTIVIADRGRPIGLLFGAIAAGSGVSPKTRRMLLSSIQVKGVPDIAVEEALWLLVEALETG